MGTASRTAGQRRGASRAGRIAATGAATAVIATGGFLGAGVASAAPLAPAAAVPCQTSQGLVSALSTTACRLLGGVVVTAGNVTGSVPRVVPRVVQVAPRVVQQPTQVVTGVTQGAAQAAAPSTGSSSSGGSSSAAPSTGSSSSGSGSSSSAPRAVPRPVAPAAAPAAPVAPTQNYSALMSSAYDRLPASFLSGAPGGFASLAPGNAMYDPGLLFSANGPFRSLPSSPVSSNSSTQALALPDSGGVGVPLLAAVVGGAALLAFAVRGGVLRRVRRSKA